MRKFIETGLVDRIATDKMIRDFQYGPVPDLRSNPRAEAWHWYAAEGERRKRVLTEAADWTYFAAKDDHDRLEMFKTMKDPYESRLYLLSEPVVTALPEPTEAP